MAKNLEQQFRQLFENDYPGIESLRINLIEPLWSDVSHPAKSDIEISENDKKKISKITIFANQNSEINFVDVELTNSVVLRKNRVTINKYIANHLIDIYQSALIFFHYQDNKKEWRISYVYKGENNKDTTSAKRYTYLCGKNYHCRTAAQRFSQLEKAGGYPNSDKLTEAFNVEALTKEFFGQLFSWYEWACKLCKFPSKNCIAKNAELSDENNQLNLIRLITRIMFVWFIKQKDLVPEWLFNKVELEKILSDSDFTSSEKGNYYNAVLQNLFFGALNRKIDERKFADKSEDGVLNEHYGIKTYYRDDNEQSFFKVSQNEIVKKLMSVPFLNGGLFECLDKVLPPEGEFKVQYIDGFSRNKKRRALVPNILFWNEVEKQPGIITILSRYNFTVEESTPSDIQVALDPELLGKVFENLLGTYNPETSESARKESGSFYTPREIVSYMVNHSIMSYLQEKVSDISKDNLEKLTNDDKSDDADINLTEEQIFAIRQALFEIKIIDPACGSGAFPMGFLNKLVEIHTLLNKLSANIESNCNLFIKKGQCINYTPNDKLKINAKYLGDQKFELSVNGKTEDKIYNSQELALYAKEIINKHNKDLNKNTIANLFSQGRIDDGKSFNAIKTTHDIRQIVDSETKEIVWQYKSYKVSNKSRPYRNEEDELLNYDILYNLKMQIIQDSIFGADIQPIAVQICKLRFFISLICEQPKTGNTENNYGYNPLPNLETKFVAANTLIGLAKIDINKESFDLFRTDEISNKQKELQKIRHDHFGVKDVNEKIEIRRTDKNLRKELAMLLEKTNVFAPEDVIQLTFWNPYDQNAVADFFDANWMFGIEDGFDIVIGNPPYVQIKKGTVTKELYPYSEGKDVGKQNLYKLFVEAAYNLLKKRGVAALIVQSSLMCDMSSAFTRELLLTKTQMLQVIEFPKVAPNDNGQVFKAALQGTCISIFSKKQPDNLSKFGISINNDTSTIKSLDFEEVNQFHLKTYFSSRYEIPLIKKGEMSIIAKVKSHPKLEEMITYSLQGNINTIHLPKIKSEKQTSIFIAKGANIHKYYIDDELFFGKNTEQVKKLVERNYNAGAVIVTQNITGTTDKYRIHAAYAECKNTNFVFLHSVNIIYLPNPSSAKYILALLNSKLLDWLFRKTSTNNHCNMYELIDLPVPNASELQQQEIIDLVDKILAAKKQDSSADTGALEEKIDELVYDLYGLTEEEKNIIRNN